MAISKGSSLANSYRFYTVAVDQYEKKELKGILYHGSLEGGIPFRNLMELIWEMDFVFERIGYPTKTMDNRQFSRSTDIEELRNKKVNAVQEMKIPKREGMLATFRICVLHRYNASWQGYAVWEETGRTVTFESFLELVRMLDGALGGTRIKDGRTVAGPFCRVAVDEYDNKSMAGQLFHTSREGGVRFQSVIELMEHMDELFCSMEDFTDRRRLNDSRVIPHQILGMCRHKGRLATFIIQILFHEKSTWQGTICWKERNQRLCFRSFLELILLMDAAIDDVAGWDEKGSQDHLKAN